MIPFARRLTPLFLHSQGDSVWRTTRRRQTVRSRRQPGCRRRRWRPHARASVTADVSSVSIGAVAVAVDVEMRPSRARWKTHIILKSHIVDQDVLRETGTGIHTGIQTPKYWATPRTSTRSCSFASLNVATMRLPCDACASRGARVYCAADDAKLCLRCDRTVRLAFARRRRVRLDERTSASASKRLTSEPLTTRIHRVPPRRR